MDSELASLGERLDPENPPHLAEARRKVVAGTKGRRKMKLSNNYRIALAACATAGFIIVPVAISASNSEGTGVPVTAPGTAPLPLWPQNPDLGKPKPGQLLFIHRRTPMTKGGWSEYMIWVPMSGDRPGLLRRSSKGLPGEPVGPGNVPGMKGLSQSWLCDGQHLISEMEKVDLAKPVDCKLTMRKAYLGGLPTTAAAMKAWIYENSQGGNPPDVQAFITVGDTLRTAYAPAKVAKAFFEATRKIPGVVEKDGLKDSLGRPAIELSQTWHGRHQGYLFDPKTFQFLGERTGRDLTAPAFSPTGGSTPDATPWTPSDNDRAQAEKDPVKPDSVTYQMGYVDAYGQVPAGG
jgi:hypothetical protein